MAWWYTTTLCCCATAPFASSSCMSLGQMHISCVEGQTFQVGLFERHWQWTASISDDRLQFYTEHHLSGPSGSDVLEQVKKMCMMDAVKAFPGHINFTT